MNNCSNIREGLFMKEEFKGKKLLVAANFSKGNVRCIMPDWTENAKLLLNNYEELERNNGTATLKPYQALVFEREPRTDI